MLVASGECLVLTVYESVPLCSVCDVKVKQLQSGKEEFKGVYTVLYLKSTPCPFKAQILV